jgi:hypothetical protein
LENKKIPHVQVPFSMEKYPDANTGLDQFKSNFNHVLIDGLSKWYNINENKSKIIFRVAFDFYQSLIDAIQPSLIISWQSMHPVSRIVREIAVARGIPWWASERGWVKNTLMVDMGENNYLSEMTSSFALSRIYDSYKVNNELINSYAEKTKNYGSIERYPNKVTGHLNVRLKYGIPASSTIFTFFSHGEPHVGTMDSLYGMQRQHELLPNYLFERIVEVANFLEQRGDYLLVKEHPFNILNKRNFNFDKLANVIILDESVDDIVAVSDYYLFSLSTLQIEVALLGKSFGLLCRGFMSATDEAPLVSNYNSIEDFIYEIENRDAWLIRSAAIEKKISFLLEYFLIDLDILNFENSVQRLATHLGKYRGLRQDVARDKLIVWLKERS